MKCGREGCGETVELNTNCRSCGRYNDAVVLLETPKHAKVTTAQTIEMLTGEKDAKTDGEG